MPSQITLPKFMNLTGIFCCAFTLLFIPLQSFPSIPVVKSATTSSVFLPVLDNTPLSTVSAKSVYIYDVDSESTVFSIDSAQKMYPASLTKIMTALVSLESYEIDRIMTVQSAENSIGSSIKLTADISMSVENLLYAALVSSGNDATVTLAENYPGGYTKFIDRMNEKARSLGLTDTYFTNVAGMEDTLHLSTSRDLTLLAATAMKNLQFRRFVSTKAITISDITKLHNFRLENTNLLLGKYDIIGVKTGTSGKAGQNLILFLNQGSHPLIITILGSTDRFKDAKILIDHLDAHLSWQEI